MLVWGQISQVAQGGQVPYQVVSLPIITWLLSDWHFPFPRSRWIGVGVGGRFVWLARSLLFLVLLVVATSH